MQITLFTALKSLKMTDKIAKSVVDVIDDTIDRRVKLSAQSLKSEISNLRTGMEALRTSLETRMTSLEAHLEAQMTGLKESVRLQLNVITVLIAILGVIGATAPIWSRFIP